MTKIEKKKNAKKKWKKRLKKLIGIKTRRLISDPVNHKYWDTAFAKALRMPKLQYQDGLTDASMTISLNEQHHRVIKKRKFRLEVEFQSDIQSSFSIYEIIGD